ncbi:O-antigen ligase family protein [Ramlibacter sp.]|uniref:O-antigen ligase family protein n=1 Tax=Ramlibacter sp. TaxID=1917967 RepID=UPI0035AF835B
MSGPADPVQADAAPLNGAERAWHAALPRLLATFGFFIPFSTAGTSIGMAIMLLMGAPVAARLWRLTPWRDPMVAVGLVLLAWIAARTWLGEAWGPQALSEVNRYHELLFLPVLLALLQLSRRRDALLLGMVAGALVLALLYWLAPLIPSAGQFLHLRRISAGFSFGLCAFVLLERARQGEGTAWFNRGAALFLALTVVFMIDSRTGHIALLVLLPFAAWRSAPQRARLPVTAAIVAAGLLAVALSGPVRQRIDETVRETQASLQGQTQLTSTGARIQLFRSAVVIVMESWPWGTGWQGWSSAFADLTRRRGYTNEQLLGAHTADNPHNEYLMQAGAGGAPALALFLAWLAVPLVRGIRRRADPWAGTAAIVTLAFAVACLFNSLLRDFIEGHVFMALMAWLLMRQRQAPP